MGRAKAGIAVGIALLLAFLTQGRLPASNEGFYSQTHVFAAGARPRGFNMLALPPRSSYQGRFGLTKLCADLHLGPDGEIIQFDGQGQIFSHSCASAAPQFQLLDGRGVVVLDIIARDGALAGTDVLFKTLPISDLGTAPKGINLYPVDYHTALLTPEDLCLDCGLSASAIVTRIDAGSGGVLSHGCGQVPGWNLVPGEAVLVIEDQGPRSCSPPHL
ncbi:MAG: hypothetical protein HY049_19795 [Acidobacteria bacterium]|nr:hypothetical protein [Acidobacteriota bacterium]